MENKILIIDDDEAILELIKVNLDLLGYQTITALDGIKGYALALQETPDLIVIDVMMPEVDGFTVVQRIRQNQQIKDTPVLMLTALDTIKDKVQGFDSGVDDYLVKPFELEELRVRTRALLKRSKKVPESIMPEILTIGDFILMPENLTIKLNEKDVKLTPTEFEILNCLVQKHGQVIPAGQLLKDVWGYSENDDIETIRVHIKHLRTKLQKASDKKYIQTVYGGGYKLLPEGA